MVVAPLLLMGMSPKCWTFDSREFTLVIYMTLSTRRLPDGVMVLLRTMACVTSSGDRLNILSFSGLTLMRTDRALDPNGGGAVRPGTLANKGLIRVIATSKMSFRLTVLLLNTSSPTGREDASKRITCGGKAPGGKNAWLRETCKATCADASPMSVPS